MESGFAPFPDGKDVSKTKTKGRKKHRRGRKSGEKAKDVME
jgi:hypothetical protein